MARSRRHDVATLVLDRHIPITTTSVNVSGNSRLKAAFSAAALRRLITDAIRCGSSSSRLLKDDSDAAPVTKSDSRSEKQHAALQPPRKAALKSEKLSDLLNLAESLERTETEGEAKKKMEALEVLKRAVRDLQVEDPLVSTAAASTVRFLAKEDSEARTALAMLGAIPPLVGMLGSEDHESQTASLYALLNIGIGNDANKAAIVKAGAVHKMLTLIESPNGVPSVSEATVANFLGLSALDSNKSIIGSSGAIPFLVTSLEDVEKKGSPQVKQDALRALYNLSILSSNIAFILETDLIFFLMNSLGDMDVSERILSILSNVVSTPEGRKAISGVRDAFVILVDVLNWTDSPECQEKASYILMVMAHKAYGDRQAMLEAGIVSSLLELSLVGSTLAQKRASRMLECLRISKGKHVSENYGGNMSAPVSALIYGYSSSSTNPNGSSRDSLMEYEDMMSDEKKAVKQLVQQSLQNNMRRIVKRANLPQEFVPSDHLKSLTTISTSKSLPFEVGTGGC